MPATTTRRTRWSGCSTAPTARRRAPARSRSPVRARSPAGARSSAACRRHGRACAVPGRCPSPAHAARERRRPAAGSIGGARSSSPAPTGTGSTPSRCRPTACARPRRRARRPTGPGCVAGSATRRRLRAGRWPPSSRGRAVRRDTGRRAPASGRAAAERRPPAPRPRREAAPAPARAARQQSRSPPQGPCRRAGRSISHVSWCPPVSSAWFGQRACRRRCRRQSRARRVSRCKEAPKA